MGKVVYRKEKKSRFPYPLLILGAVVVFGFSLVNLVFPKRDQLELENRKAAQLPAKRWARDRRLEYLELSVLSQNAPAIALYESHDFVEATRVMRCML